MGCREITVGQAQKDEESQVRTANLPLGLEAVIVTELGDPGKGITGEPSKEESRKLVRCWYQSGGEAGRECGKSSQEISSSEEEMASGSWQHRASRRLALSSLLCRAALQRTRLEKQPCARHWQRRGSVVGGGFLGDCGCARSTGRKGKETKDGWQMGDRQSSLSPT